MAVEHEGQTKVGVVGAGMVGTSFAYALMQRGIATDLVLIDAQHEKAEGEVMDLTHGLPFVRPMRISAGSYADLTGAAVTVVTAGQAQGGKDESRLDLLERNAEVMRQVIPEIVKHNPDGVIVIASNPVDLLTHLAVKISGVPPTQVFGSGTILDTARFRALLSAHYTVDPRSVHAYIIGEHGDSEVPLWSLANIAGVGLPDFRAASGVGYDQHALDAIFEQTRTAAYQVVERKGATNYAIGLGLLAIVEAIIGDQHAILSVSSLMTGEYGVRDICVSLPTIVGARGVEAVLKIPLSADEEQAFQRSAALLTQHFSSIDADKKQTS